MKKNTVYSTEGSIWKSLLLTFPMILLIIVFTTGGTPDFSTPDKSIAFLVTFVFLISLFFMILYTGRTDRFRAIGFVTLALFFALTFIVNLIKARGAMTFNNENLWHVKFPFATWLPP